MIKSNIETANTGQKMCLRNDLSPWAAALLVFCITFAVFLPSLRNDFVFQDDDVYMYNNPNIRSIDSKLLRWSFSFEANPLWHPLTLLSHAAAYAVFGMAPWGHRLINITLHAMNTCLVFMLTISLLTMYEMRKSKMNDMVIAGMITALHFGLHPLRTESVVWISERKDVLYGFFFLLSLYCYCKYLTVPHKKRIFFSISFISFILAIVSKPIAVTYPAILLLLDYYPANRLMFVKNIHPYIHLFKEKLPFFLIAIISFMLTTHSLKSGDIIQIGEYYSLPVRLAMGIRSIIFYLIKLLFPFNLSQYYPYPLSFSFFSYEYVGSLLLSGIFTFYAVRSRKTQKFFFTIWFYYLILLIPTIGFVPIGEYIAADRYTYLSTLGFSLCIGIGISLLIERLGKKQFFHIVLSIIIALTLLITRTVHQTTVWKNSFSLLSQQIKVFPKTAFFAYYNRGCIFFDLGKFEDAVNDLTRAIRMEYGYIPFKKKAEYLIAHFRRGEAYFNLGRFKEARADLTAIIEVAPQQDEAYVNRGIISLMLNDYHSAIDDFNKAIEIDPDIAEAYNNRGIAYLNLNEHKKAKEDFFHAIRLDPSLQQAYNNLQLIDNSLGSGVKNENNKYH